MHREPSHFTASRPRATRNQPLRRRCPCRAQRVDLTLSVGEMAVDYTEVAKKEHLTELEVEIRKLNDKLRDIMKEVEYQRKREEEFRNTSESTNSRVQWWSIAQVRGSVCARAPPPSFPVLA